MVYTGKDGNLPYTWKYSSPFYFRTCRPWCMSPWNLRLGEFETIFIDFYRLCIPVLIKISLFLIFWRWGGGAKLERRKHRAKKKLYTASNAVWQWRGYIECTFDHFEAKSTNTKIFSFFLVYIWNCVWPYNP